MRVNIPVVDFEFEFRGEKLSVREGRYHRPAAPSLMIYGKHGEPYATLTCNLSKMPAPGEFFIKTWSENAEIAAAVLETGRFEDTGGRILTGYVAAQVWRYVG